MHKVFFTHNTNKAFSETDIPNLDVCFVSDYQSSINSINLLNDKRAKECLLEDTSPVIDGSYERIINKKGIANIDRINIKQFKFISDYFNTIIDLHWCYIITLFSLAFLSSWLLFTVFWYVAALVYFNYYEIECVSGLEHNTAFYDYFLFSIETQQTIGYGTRAISSQCGFSSIVLILQCWSNIFLECFFSNFFFIFLLHLIR